MNQEPVNHPTVRGAQAGVVAGVVAAIAAGVAGVIDNGDFFTFPKYVAEMLFLDGTGLESIVFGLVVHVLISGLFGAIYAYFAHWADFDRFESVVPILLTAMLYGVALYIMSFTLFVGLFSEQMGEISMVVSMAMVFVYALVLTAMLWRPRVSYEELDQGVKDLGADPYVRSHKAPNEAPPVK